MVFPTVIAMRQPDGTRRAAAWLAAAMLTDAIDGPIARRRGEVSRMGQLLDPIAEATFVGSKLDHERRKQGNGPVLFEYHRTLIALRKSNPVLADLSKRGLNVIGYDDIGVMFVHRSNDAGQVFVVFNFDEKVISRSFPVPSGQWHLLFDSRASQWRAADDSSDPAIVSPDSIDSKGEVVLDLPPQGFIVYQRHNR